MMNASHKQRSKSKTKLEQLRGQKRPKATLEEQTTNDTVEGLLTLEETTARFKFHRIKGLSCQESVRRAIAAKRIPATKAKWPARGFRIKESEVDAIINKLKPEVEKTNSVHKQLYAFFSADPLHTPVLAVLQGISTSADETERIYRLFKKHQPTIQAYKARQAHGEWETKQAELAKREPPCEACKRTHFEARRESANVVAEV